MKKYYVVAARSGANRENIQITVTDCPPRPNNGYQYLLEIEANNYNEALQKVSFVKRLNGDSHYL